MILKNKKYNRYPFSVTAALLVFITLALQGCLSPKRCTRLVDARIQEIKTINNPAPNYVTFDFSQLKSLDTSVHSAWEKKKLIPLLIFFKWDYSVKTQINPVLSGNYFAACFLKHAGQQSLQQKLKDQRLTIVFEQIPHKFFFIDKGMAFGMYSSSTTGIVPENQDLSVRYHTELNGEVKIVGDFSLPHRIFPINSGTIKQGTEEFMKAYKNRLDFMAKQLVDQISSGL